MESLQKKYLQLLKVTSTKYVRGIYDKIDWNSRLISIKGARGVGKTTLMFQRIALAFPDPEKALYATLDDIWFGANSLVDLAEKAAEAGITHLFLDEVHRLPGWEQQIKNIYDLFPSLSIVFTGSSLLVIDHSIADLSRRCLSYSMPGLSFREYLEFEGIKRATLTLTDVLYDHERLAPEMIGDIDILKAFHKYLVRGFYPFYKTDSLESHMMRVGNIVTAVIDYDIPAVERVEYATLLKIKHLLTIMAAQTPSPLNITAIATSMGITKNQVVKMLSLLGSSEILRLLYYKGERNPNSMAKPQKVLINNSSIAYALGQADLGKVRESFLASMLSVGHEVSYPRQGDLLADGRYLFEIGGKGKNFGQIKDIPDSFIAADDIIYGFGNKIPLWLFGFLY